MAYAISISVLALVSFSPAVRADELKLKDGTTISGTIVGFEENSFKVKTSYGFAEVQKDQVVSIVISASAKKKEPEKKSEPVPDSPAAAEAPTAKPSKPTPTVANNPTAPTNSVASSISGSTNSASKAASKPAANATAPNSAATNVPPTTAPATPPAPAKPAPPEPMREEVNGNSYVNDTYGFRMYKPPAWKVIEGARALLPGSITAMGTDDQTTYLLIGQQSGTSQSVATDMDATDRRLREIMENFRPLDEKHVTISGAPAVERHFRGSVDQHDWSGVVVYIPHDSHLYTIFGMTIADTDLVQIQENIIARAISSLQFTK
ncbi:MAG: hypothetical protein WCD49_10215 [Candidatus Acidiferrales bacterium]